jgi:hypothetical protein
MRRVNNGTLFSIAAIVCFSVAVGRSEDRLTDRSVTREYTIKQEMAMPLTSLLQKAKDVKQVMLLPRKVGDDAVTISVDTSVKQHSVIWSFVQLINPPHGNHVSQNRVDPRTLGIKGATQKLPSGSRHRRVNGPLL